MREEKLIRSLLRLFPGSTIRRSRPFCSDAEIFDVGGVTLAVTTDEFSAEDGLSEREPWPLGRNLIVAVISDLLAVGAEPKAVLDALVVTPDMDEAWVKAFAGGMWDALDEVGAELVGGDLGTADAWRFTGTAIGLVEGTSMDRIAPLGEGTIVATGRFGDGNLAAVTGATPHFECRLPESLALRESRAACIDTSDGLASALATFAALTPDLALTVDRGAVELSCDVAEAAAEIGVPPEAFLLGAAGEYELLALVPGHDVPEEGSLHRIGSFARSREPGIRWTDGTTIVPQPLLPDPRRPGVDYRAAVAALAVEMFGGRP